MSHSTQSVLAPNLTQIPEHGPLVDRNKLQLMWFVGLAAVVPLGLRLEVWAFGDSEPPVIRSRLNVRHCANRSEGREPQETCPGLHSIAIPQNHDDLASEVSIISGLSLLFRLAISTGSFYISPGISMPPLTPLPLPTYKRRKNEKEPQHVTRTGLTPV